MMNIRIDPDKVAAVYIHEEWCLTPHGLLVGEALVIGGHGALSGEDWFAFVDAEGTWVEGRLSLITLIKESP